MFIRNAIQFFCFSLFSSLLFAAPQGNAQQSDARARFIEIEKIARESNEKQTQDLGRLYRELALPLMNPFVEAILSSHPRSLLNRNSGKFDGSTRGWSDELGKAANTKTIEQVAQELENQLWLNVAARARALHVFEQQKPAVQSLLELDLSQSDQSSVYRASATISSLGWSEYNSRLLEIMLTCDDNKVVEAVRRSLLFSQKPIELAELLKLLAEDPRSLRVTSAFFQSSLYREETPELLLKQLDASEKEIRLSAADAIRHCSDSRLVPHVFRFAVDPEPKFREIAVDIGCAQEAEVFAKLRSTMRKLTRDRNTQVSFGAIACLAKQQDLWVGKSLLEMLEDESIALGNRVTVMQSLAALAGKQFGYNMHEWGAATPENQVALSKFRGWLAEQDSAED